MSLTPITPASATPRASAVEAVDVVPARVDRNPTGALATAQGARTAVPANPLEQAVLAARAATAGRQSSAAPLHADLLQAFNAPGLPAAIRTAIGQVLALQVSAGAPITADVLRQAVGRSGLFLEARLAKDPRNTKPDLKAALLTLQRALPPADPATPPRTAPATVPPPLSDGALTAQPPAAATFPKDAEPLVIAQHLRGEVEQTLARQTLHQLASLPDGSAVRWMFELPFATPQGAAIAQFEIERDDTGGAEQDGGETWRARFSIDLEPLGPIHVSLRAQGERTAVTVWAEREASYERLRGEGETLAQALAAEVVFHPGAPPSAAPPPGQFIDQTT